jgi:hypothetical protein
MRYSIFALVLCVACTANSDRNNDTPPTVAVNHESEPVSKPKQDAGSTNSNVDDSGTVPDATGSTDSDSGNSGYLYRPYDINHLLVTGQSNSVSLSTYPLSKTQPYSNLQFDTGTMPMYNCDGAGCKTYAAPASFIPLVEGDYFFYGSPAETLASGLANQITTFSKDHVSLVSIHGRSGNTYWCLRKGSCNYKPGYLQPFEQGLQEVRDAKAIAKASNKSYVVRATFTVHGESDHYSYGYGTPEFPLYGSDGTPAKLKDYTDALIEWQSDYETEVKKITGQQETIPMFASQLSGWNDTKQSVLANMQLEAHKRSNGKVILVAPGYPFDYLSDCKHLTGHSQRHLGEYFAKVYHKVIVDGKRWEPVYPKHIERFDDYINISFHVPVEPLVWDTESVSNPGNYGFEFTDDKNTTIKLVHFAGPNTVIIQLSQTPGNNKKLTYAQNQIPNTCIGKYGARGNLRDSDLTVSYYGNKLPNWAISFISNIE